MAEPEEPQGGPGRRAPGAHVLMGVLYLGLVAWALWQWFAA